jgi:hypothetical protein
MLRVFRLRLLHLWEVAQPLILTVVRYLVTFLMFPRVSGDVSTKRYINMNRLERAAEFGSMMGKQAADTLKSAACWTGYERVPGTAALTEGSCRPVGKKKKEEKPEKKASEAWQKAEGKNPDGGLNEKGRKSLKAKGQDIKRPQPEGGSRKDSFCARMGGMKSKLTSSETANDPDSRINKALRKWKC